MWATGDPDTQAGCGDKSCSKQKRSTRISNNKSPSAVLKLSGFIRRAVFSGLANTTEGLDAGEAHSKVPYSRKITAGL